MSGLSQEARALIDGVVELDAPSPFDKARIQQRLSVQLGAAAFAATLVPLASAGGAAPLASASSSVAAAATSASLAPKAAWLGGLGKALLSAAALGGLSVALWLGTNQSGPAPGPHALPSAAAVANAPALPSVVEAPSAAPAAESVASVAPESEPVALRAAARPKTRAKLAPDSALAAPTDTLGAELILLGRAQAALRAGRSQEALSLAAQHRAQFPEGAMKQERMGVAALAQCALGGARDEAQAFLQLASGSPLAARVRKACGLP